MKNEVILLVPEAPAPKAAQMDVRARKGPIEALRLGTLGNSKANADPLLRLMVETVHGEVSLRSVVSLSKANASVAASAEIYDRLASETDLVISAMAD